MGISTFGVGTESVWSVLVTEFGMHTFPEWREIKPWMKLSPILYKY